MGSPQQIDIAVPATILIGVRHKQAFATQRSAKRISCEA